MYSAGIIILPIIFLLVGFTAFGIFVINPETYKDSKKDIQPEEIDDSNLLYYYSIIGSLSLGASVVTIIILVAKFSGQTEAYGYIAYSDTFARYFFKNKNILYGNY